MSSSLSQVSSASHANQTYFLDPEQRPDDLQEIIDSSFESLAKDNASHWGLYNGNPEYKICHVKEQAMFKKIIQENAAKGQKEFYALDIGAGNFDWGKDMAKYLNAQTDLPADIKINIISVRGESNPGEHIIEDGRCKIYNLGAFKVEEIIEAFQEEGLDLENKIDLTVSNWCFRHLADPVGTFVQSYNLLRPQTGTILLNGFLFLLNDSSVNGLDGNLEITQLFLDTKSPFLTRYNSTTRSVNDFMLRRADNTPCQLPMSYLEHVEAPRYGIGSGIMTRFKRESQPDDDQFFDLPTDWQHSTDLYGDKKMYEWLKNNDLLHAPSAIWKPVVRKDQELSSPPLHQAVLKGDKDGVLRLLTAANINESDSNGNLPLHLAIQQQNRELFDLLLQRGSSLTLKNGENRAALHEAATYDQDGYFIQALIAAGANVYKGQLGRHSFKNTPLDFAIKAKNFKAIEILIKAGATLTKANREELMKQEFAAIQALGIIPSNSNNNK